MQRTAKIITVTAIILFLCLVPIVSATSETFTVPNTQEIARSVNLEKGASVQGTVKASGGSGNDINFFVTSANGSEILRDDRATNTPFSFSADVAGTYVMHFDNTFSPTSPKSITLDYTITEPPQPTDTNTIIWVLGAIVAFLIILVLLLLTRRRRY